MLIGLSTGYIKPLNPKIVLFAHYVSGKNITIALPQNPWGRIETCLVSIIVGCLCSTQSKMTDIVSGSNQMVLFSLKPLGWVYSCYAQNYTASAETSGLTFVKKHTFEV